MNTLDRTPHKTFIPANPLINKLKSVDDIDETECTYLGVFKKTLFFIAMTALGVLLTVYFAASGAITVNPLTDELFVDTIVVWLLLISAGIFVIFPFLAFLLRITIPVTGALYCMAVGFLFSFFATLDAELGSYIMLALVLTLAIVTVMGYLFAKGIIRVTAKLRAVSTSLLLAAVAGSLLLAACSFLPVLGDCIRHLTANPLVSILASASGMIIAILFLLVDFDNIRAIVEDDLPKKYEWYASFSLVFTMVWVYLKVLHLVMQATSKGK